MCISNEAIQLLHHSSCSCVIVQGTHYHTYYGRGISDLYRLLEENPECLQQAYVADKIVGKGAAALMILGKVAEVYADVISESALALLQTEKIPVSYHQKVPHIINRKGNGICPVETLCAPCQKASECLPLIRTFLQQIKINSSIPSV